jgi:hypothetical protein
MSDQNLLEGKFAKIGARLKMRSNDRRPNRSRFMFSRQQQTDNGSVRLDVQTDNKGEFFDIAIFGGDEGKKPELTILDVQPDDRHLLLMAKNATGSKSKYLCGHDERHWFVAAIPESAPVGTVRQAKEALKPPEVQARQTGIKAKDRNRRKNDAYIRQGEWFFIPTKISEPDPVLVLKKEPLSRGRGSKPHMMEFCYRSGGTQVYVCSRYPNGVDVNTYNRILRTEKDAKGYGWRVMVRDAAVYCKGRITHADHKTITLVGWHRVMMNTENKAEAMRHVAFLD